MLKKVIQDLAIFFCWGMFFYSYFFDGNIKDLVLWGILLLFNFIGKCTDVIIEE